jgi:hypothetical protein
MFQLPVSVDAYRAGVTCVRLCGANEGQLLTWRAIMQPQSSRQRLRAADCGSYAIGDCSKQRIGLLAVE